MNEPDVAVTPAPSPGGEVSVQSQGYKHSAVPIVCAALLCRQLPIRIENVPDVHDIHAIVTVANELGAHVEFEQGALTVHSAAITKHEIPSSIGSAVHGSIYLWPVILAKTGRLGAPVPGGCSLGGGAYPDGRPVQNVLDVMKAFGARGILHTGRIEATWGDAERRAATVDISNWSASRRRINGSEVTSSTKFAMLMASSLQAGKIINWASRESIHDLAEFLHACVCSIHRDSRAMDFASARTQTASAWRIESDPTEFMTFIALAALLGYERLTLTHVSANMLERRFTPERTRLARMGINIDQDGSTVRVDLPVERILGTRIVATTAGVNTDSQPFFAAIFACARSPGRITDSIWRGRYAYAEHLRSFGIPVERTNFGLMIGRWSPGSSEEHTQFVARDTREAALLCCLAARAATGGEIVIRGARSHLERGYSNFLAKLAQFGIRARWCAKA